MTTVQLTIICLTLLLVVAVIAGAPRPLGRPKAAIVEPGESNVVLHIGDGQSIRGTVLACEDGVVTVKDAALLSSGQEVKLGGTARLAESEVTLVQAL